MRAKFPLTWILTADSGAMRLYECRDWQDGLHELPEFAADAAAPDFARDLKSDKPGRAFGADGRRGALEPHHDPLKLAKRDFVALIAEELGQAFAAGRFERLVIAAAPKTLGALRDLLDDKVKAAVAAEIDKDLVKADSAQVAAAVDSVLHPARA